MDSVIGRGTVLAGRYQLRDERVSGLPGVAQWAAVDQILVRPVTVQVLPEAGAGPALDAARRAALVSDPRLVRVLDVGTYEGAGYVVTEQVNGSTLAQLVGREPLSADQARAVVGEAATALEAARRRGVHHLALRPSSLAVSDDGRVLVQGLAFDSAVLRTAGGDARTTSRTDATDLVRLVYTALTGHWPGPLETADGLPTAPETDGVPVPPGDLVPGVPPDLDTLCVVTLGRQDDGPHSPAELVRELEPWGEIRVAGAAVQPPPPVVPAVPPTTGPVVRQSVRSAFGAPNHAANRPGTPPPAAPGRTGAYPVVPPAAPYQTAPAFQPAAFPPPAGGLPPAAGAVPPAFAPPAVPPPAVPPPVAPPTVPPPAVPPPGPLGFGPEHPSAESPRFAPRSGEPDPFDFGEVEDEAPPRRVGTGIAVAVLVLLVVVALAFAVKALLSGLGDGEPAAAQTTASQTPSTGASAPPAGGATTPATPTPTAPRPGAVPVISEIHSIDPSDTDGEHEEAVGRAIDGDPGTFWFSQTYNRDDFAGFKEGAGLVLTFAEPATVSTVTLHVNGTGGNVEIRATDATSPTAGPVLASGALGPDTVLELSPAPTTSTLVVWFTQLPTNAAGQFRIELTELTLG